MSTQGATALYERFASDEEFRARLEDAPTQDEARRLVTEAGYDVSLDDLPAIRNLVGVRELSDEDLEKVAGGGATTVDAVGSVATVAAVACMAAAAACG
jgi:predicted ribosomally synthesized peptide with nif11-like leader